MAAHERCIVIGRSAANHHQKMRFRGRKLTQALVYGALFFLVLYLKTIWLDGVDLMEEEEEDEIERRATAHQIVTPGRRTDHLKTEVGPRGGHVINDDDDHVDVVDDAAVIDDVMKFRRERFEKYR